MKKFIKFFIIALAIIAAVIITCVIFFTNLNKNKESKVSVLEFANVETRQTLNTKLATVAEAVSKSDPDDNRFNVVINTLNNLNDSLAVLSTYYIEDDGNIKNQEIATSINTVTSLMKTSISMAKEFEIKSTSNFYDQNLGANDFFENTAKYIVNYSNLLILLSNNITNVQKDADIKFSMIDAYCRVCINEFASRERATNKWIRLVSDANISYFNSYFSLNKSQLITSDGLFSVNNNNFISAYNNCNKDEFAKNLKTNCYSVSSNENLTNEQTATFYFKKVYGIKYEV